ncbi:MAG: HEPN domain-containing protein [Acidobacteriota bacterium]|nr:HEPN domain-containing protein [Acidobacteriota bacterium]
MKPSTLEWVEKAEVDWEVAQRSYRARSVELHDAVCYHCQQCIEKYLKARLNEANAYFTKTHNLEDLLKLLLPIEPGWTVLQPKMVALNPYAVLFRYPGFDATKADAKDALKDCKELRKIIRANLGLPV